MQKSVSEKNVFDTSRFVIRRVGVARNCFIKTYPPPNPLRKGGGFKVGNPPLPQFYHLGRRLLKRQALSTIILHFSQSSIFNNKEQ
ncbi:hypothetical protein CQA40_05260 [Helicobacter sp. MIT 01-3238]|nr:hypothetical protein CQA40_05260 [Helicobacter sp. MIT 01-3238]